MNLQHTHESTPFSKTSKEIILVCDGVQSPANVGSLFRLADAFGVKSMVFCNTEIDVSSNRLKRTSRSTELSIPFETITNIESRLSQLKDDDYCLVALEIASGSKKIQNHSLTHAQKIVLIIGNEKHGISSTILAELDETLYIEMFGKNSSMNVSHAAGIALYELTKTN